MIKGYGAVPVARKIWSGFSRYWHGVGPYVFVQIVSGQPELGLFNEF